MKRELHIYKIFIRIFVKLWFLAIFMEYMTKNGVFFANPSLTLAQTQTLSIVSAVLAILLPVVVTTARFLILRTWIHHTIWDGSRV